VFVHGARADSVSFPHPVMDVGIDSHSAEREGDGNCSYTRGLVRGLLALDGAERVTLFARDPGHDFYRSLGGHARVRVRAGGRGGGMARVLGGLARAASRAHVDCLHVQYFAPLRCGQPLVVTVHDLGFLRVPSSFPRGLRLALRVLVAHSVRRAARVITVSRFSARDLVQHYRLSPERVVVIPPGAGQEFRPWTDAEVRAVLARYGLTPGFLFSLGRLNRRKNLGGLLRAYAALDDAIRVPLVVGGREDHGAAEFMRALGAAGSSRQVRWVGLIPGADLPAFYGGAAAFVYPSLYEGFGLPVLEAMACGCPVICADGTALPEVAGDAALMVDPTATEALTAAIERLLSEPGLVEDLRARGLARSRRFTWEDAARHTRDVYREVIAPRARPSPA
jgi:glycosyltransferase involved in cell wall biosynthesis